MIVTWTEKGISWYDKKYDSGELQNNGNGRTYYYCALGYDKDAEA